MVYSMTGFGSASGHINDKEIKVEIRALNSKFTDIRLKIPSIYKEYEMELRKMIQRDAIRGKIDFTIESLSEVDTQDFVINEKVLDAYIHQLKSYASDHDLDTSNLLATLTQMPNVIVPKVEAVPEDEWKHIQQLASAALENLRKFRLEEGRATEQVLRASIARINQAVEEIKPYEEDRITTIKNRISQNLAADISRENMDANRFEQELIYYLEKLDFSEEQERLLQHTSYFMETLEANQPIKGKKLAFISQEMGREINTLGSKAQHSDIQRIVVGMKDDLEKIKEQLFNII